MDMPEKIDKEQVRHIAKLARLEMDEPEIELFSIQLSSILDYITKLNELNTDSVEPLAHCLPIHNVLRADEVKDSLAPDEALGNAPEKIDEYFKVPKILDDGSSA
jgi:aspartyl-tRNA(Asn)/glutamyl-tRNA(Gln) amidotransferase subunit C